MRAAVLAALVLLAGCGQEEAPPAPQAAPTTTTPTTAAPTPSTNTASEEAFLRELRAAGLFGTYQDTELVALGHAFCISRIAGQDPYLLGAPNSDGTYRFSEVSVPVDVLDVFEVDFAARDHLCPGV